MLAMDGIGLMAKEAAIRTSRPMTTSSAAICFVCLRKDDAISKTTVTMSKAIKP
jgi:hypothetical protein